MATAKQYLEWHGQQWRVRLKVPAKVRDIIGRGKLTHPLHTADLKEANERKWPVVARLKSVIASAEKAIASSDPLPAEALSHRLHKDEDGTQYFIHERAEQLEVEKGYASAKAFYGLASGQVTPLDEYAEAFAIYRAYRLKSQGDFLRVLGWLSDWLRDSNLPVALEAIDRKVAGRFIAEQLTLGRSPKKANAYLSFIREYWKWLTMRGYHEGDSPWAGQQIAKVHSRDKQSPSLRPFTDDEVLSLLSGEARSELMVAMRIAALSGMRIEEICQLRLAHCSDGTFRVVVGKTANAARIIPVHSQLSALVEKRVQTGKPDEYLVTGLRTRTESAETRSDPLSKAFTRYRRSLDIGGSKGERGEVDFHSFRRWFARKARNAMLAGAAGFNEWTIAELVGHSTEGAPASLMLSQSHYPGPDPLAAKRAVIEAVRLPDRSPVSMS